MTHKDLKNKYNSLHLEYSIRKEKLSKSIRQYGLFRIVFFLLWLVLVYMSTNWSWTAFGIITGLGIISFAYLVKKHSAMHRKKAVLEQLVRINEEEEAVMEWDYFDLPDGSRYKDDIHLFSHDLDLFGRGSLFQYINRSSTIAGMDRLATMITYIEKSASEIRQRQQAVEELAEKFQWRQDFRVKGLLVEELPDDIAGLRKWVNSPPDFKAIIFHVLVAAVPIVNLGIFMLSVFGVITFWHFLAYLTIPLILSGIKHKKVNRKYNILGKKFHVLKKYSGLFSMIEKESFQSERMTMLKGELMVNGISASNAIRKLAGIVSAFDTRLNLLAGFLMNILFLWDIRQSLRLEMWQRKYKDQLPLWFDVMAETDAYVSLAGFSYNNPGFVYPEIREEKELFLESEQLGHPLIHVNKRVCNDFSVDGWKNFIILTGANMAGKSTFLRTVGVNMILGSCGAPVCARSLSFTPVDIVTSIHTIDSLADNESYFYAELKRLKLIIDMLKEGKSVFIILDEILKGTNSKDKQSGSRALIKQLISLDASGIIATHDLKLGELEKQFPKNVKNRCFEIIIEKDRLEYDYLLKDGIAQNMNATILMERMGITVN